MNVDDRLRRALHDEADGVEPDPRSWSRVETGVRRARRRRRAGAAVATAAVVIAALVAVPTLVDRDDVRVETPPAHEGPTSTTAPPTTDAPTSSTTIAGVPVGGVDVTTAIWPFTSQDQVDAYEANPGVGMFFDPEATALELARAYLGMPDPVRDGAVEVIGDDRAVVRVRPKPASPVITVLTLQRFDGPDGPWSIIGATTDHIVVDVPDGGTHIVSPVHVAGQSIAFEAVVHAEVREDGQEFGQSLGATTVMGGGTEMAPFSGDITFDAPTSSGGALVLFTDSAEDGSIVEATIVRVQFGT